MAAISFRKDIMKAQFVNLQAAADYMGPGAIEVDRYQTEITDIVRRRGAFGQRIKQVPATGHPSRFFEETGIPAPSAANGFVDPRNIVPTLVTPTRVERSVPLKCLVSQINYNVFDHGGRRAAEPVRLPAGEGPGGCRRRPAAHPRRRAVERQRHLAVKSHNAAVLRRVRTDRRWRQRHDHYTLRTASWTA